MLLVVDCYQNMVLPMPSQNLLITHGAMLRCGVVGLLSAYMVCFSIRFEKFDNGVQSSSALKDFS